MAGARMAIQLLVGFGFGILIGLGLASRRRKKDEKQVAGHVSGACIEQIREMFCRSVDITMSCVEESQKLSTPCGLAGGIVCIAHSTGDLEIVQISKNLAPMLDHAKTVQDLLPQSFASAHLKLVAESVRDGRAPFSAMHPLDVRIRVKGDMMHEVTLKVVALSGNEFLVIIVFADGYKNIEMQKDEVLVAHFGGSRVLSRDYIRGSMPSHHSYERLTILFLDIKGFTNFVVSHDRDHVAAKLEAQFLKKAFHSCVATLIRVHKLWCMETRGDCYILMSGSSMVTSDAPTTQASRMIRFAHDLSNQDQLSLQFRVGIATGIAEVFFIYGSSSSAPILCTTGPTMVTAARLETSGFPKYAHICSNTIEKLKEEEFDFQGHAPKLKENNLKGLPTIHSALYSCATGTFQH